MSTVPIGFDRPTFARGLRAAAVFVAAAILVLALTEPALSASGARVVSITRATAIGIAALVALVSAPRWSALALQGLAYLLIVSLTVTTSIVLTVEPNTVWQSAARLVGILFGAAVFAGWSWRWQLASAVTICGGFVTIVVLGVPRSAFVADEIPRLTLGLAVIGAGSVYGAHLAHRERLRLAASEIRYRGLFESAGDAIALLDDAGVIREANAALAHLIGLPVEQIVNRRLAEFYAPPPPTGAAPGDRRTTTQGLRRADGKLVDVDVSISRAEGSATPLAQAILRDLTERTAADRRQIQEQRLDALARFAGGIAHQFNNILGGILTHAAVLREDAANLRSAGELDEILDAARRGRALTQELLRFTRHEIITLVPTPPVSLLESVAALARAALPKDAVVEIAVATGTPPLAGDADHLVSAFLQLVFNARDAMAGRPDNRLTLGAAAQDVAPADPRWPGTAPGRYVRLSVGDNGPGMDAATLEHAFEPFFSTKPMHQAAGLGLAAVYSVVRDHKGTARVESVLGRGTTVHLLIPAATEPAATPAAAPQAGVSAAPTGGVILVVDDEAIVRNSLKRALTRFGYTVLEAGDGAQALVQLQGAQPPVDLVILDLVLPGGGAGVFELLKAVRPDLRVLLSSGYSPDADNAKALATRVQGFLPKPYEIKELRDAVAKALSAPPPTPPHP